MYFQVLQLRLIAALKGRIRSGELTERRLARLAGISQPHIHNVLKGARILSPIVADQILQTLHISVFDLFHSHELAGIGRSGGPMAGRYAEVPVLEGRIGPGFPAPKRENPIERYPFPHAQVAPLRQPAVARLAADEGMRQWFSAGDVALLDRSPDLRKQVGAGGLYVTTHESAALVRYVAADAGGVRVSTGFPEERPVWDCISPRPEDILDVVLARIVWIGRDMERSFSAGETPQETGGAHRGAGRKG